MRGLAFRVYPHKYTCFYKRRSFSPRKQCCRHGNRTYRDNICIRKFHNNYCAAVIYHFNSRHGKCKLHYNRSYNRRRRHGKSSKARLYFLGLGFVLGCFAAVVILLLRSPIINYYKVSEEAKAIAWELMDAISFIIIFQSMNSVLTKGVLRAGGDTRFLMAGDIFIPLGSIHSPWLSCRACSTYASLLDLYHAKNRPDNKMRLVLFPSAQPEMDEEDSSSLKKSKFNIL